MLGVAVGHPEDVRADRHGPSTRWLPCQDFWGAKLAQRSFAGHRSAGCRGQLCAVSPARKGRLLAGLEGTLGIREPVDLDQRSDQPSPAGLVTRAQPGAVVPLEVLVEQDVVAPVGVALKLLHAAVNGSPPLLVAGEGPDQTLGDLLAHLEQVHQLAGARRA